MQVLARLAYIVESDPLVKPQAHVPLMVLNSQSVQAKHSTSLVVLHLEILELWDSLRKGLGLLLPSFQRHKDVA